MKYPPMCFSHVEPGIPRQIGNPSRWRSSPREPDASVVETAVNSVDVLFRSVSQVAPTANKLVIKLPKAGLVGT